MKKIATTLAVVSAAALMTACGGGGGSSGAVSAEYQITLRADKSQLPLNIDGYPASNGVYAPFTRLLDPLNAWLSVMSALRGDGCWGTSIVSHGRAGAHMA